MMFSGEHVRDSTNASHLRINIIPAKTIVPPSSTRSTRADLAILAIALGVIGFVLVVTTVRGGFIVDEINYMVTVTGLREGTLTVPGTGGFPPSNELLYFDPDPYARTVRTTPVSSLAPPLYAPIALPFSFLGWRGLVLLNTLSYIFSALLIYLLVRRYATGSWQPWIAVALFVLGGYSAEYAQGVWPHMLSVFLCISAFYCVCVAWDKKELSYSVLGGFLIGLACGVREQNIFLAGCLGLIVFLWSSQRLKSVSAYLAGISVPLLACSVMNYFRHGVFFPLPKAYAYAQYVSHPGNSSSWFRPLEVFLVKVLDFSSLVWFQDPTQFLDYAREPSTGAFLVGGIVKKALVQSSPWILLALVLCVTVWSRKEKFISARTRIARAITILVILPLAMFSLAGFRMDGLAFNQRYLLEIVPFAAIIVALCLEDLSGLQVHIVVGILSAAGAFAVLLITGSSQVQHLAILRMPLVLGSVLIVCWFLRRRSTMRSVGGIVLGLCIGWSVMVQSIDLTTSRRIRLTNSVGLDSLEAKIPDHSALFAYWGAQKSTAGPMQLDKDVIILDAWADNGKEAPTLAQDLLHANRRVFLYGTGMPQAMIQGISGSDSLATVLTKPFLLYEIVQRNAESVRNAVRSSSSTSRTAF